MHERGQQPRRGRSYSMATGVVLGMIVSGVLVPFVVGRTGSTTSPGVGAIASGAQGAGDQTVTTQPGDSGAGVMPLPADGRANQSATDPTGGTQVAANARLTATDIGVSPTAIKVGALVPDLGSVQKLGFAIDGGDPEQQYRVYADDINRRGGINGRKVEVAIQRFDPAQTDTMQAACVAIADDAKVFAALSNGGFFGAAVQCLTRDRHVPLIVSIDSSPEEFYTESGGRLFTELMNKHRIMRAFVGELDRVGALRGRKLGIVDADLPADKTAVDGGLMPALAQFGYKVTLRQTLSGDMASQASQMPVAVQRMRTAGVDTILLPMNAVYNAQFVREADAQRYHPKYWASDFAGGTSDFAVQTMPDSFDGTIGFTSLRTGEHRTSAPEAPADATCRAVFEKGTGTTLERGDGPYQATLGVCGLMQQFEVAARLAGPALTRDGFSQSLRRQHDVTMPFFGGTGSYGPAKFDAADSLRTVKASTKCQCWLPVDDFRRSRY